MISYKKLADDQWIQGLSLRTLKFRCNSQDSIPSKRFMSLQINHSPIECHMPLTFWRSKPCVWRLSLDIPVVIILSHRNSIWVPRWRFRLSFDIPTNRDSTSVQQVTQSRRRTISFVLRGSSQFKWKCIGIVVLDRKSSRGSHMPDQKCDICESKMLNLGCQ